MTAAAEPLFIDTGDRRLFGLYHPATDDARGCMLMLPPFAEEMNMSRRMIYLTGRAFAAAGYGFLSLDLTGTGDSSGDFTDARWSIWQDDARAGAAWLSDKTGNAPILMGLRAGALLAASLQSPDPLILWQPVGNGETMLNQFLRIRVAAALTGNAEKETTKDLRAMWQAGDAVEVAGYEIDPALAAGLDPLRLADMPPQAGASVIWVETGTEDRGPNPASQRVIDAWSQQDMNIQTCLCPGDPFWTIQETTTAPAMIDITIDALQSL
jgi:exosortase A-associated hydrolase 2